MKPFWVCRSDGGIYEIWGIKPKWDVDDKIFMPPQSESITPNGYGGWMKSQFAKVIMPEAIKGLRVGCSRKVQP